MDIGTQRRVIIVEKEAFQVPLPPRSGVREDQTESRDAPWSDPATGR